MWRQLSRIMSNNWFAMLIQMDVNSDKLSRRLAMLPTFALRVLGPLLRLLSSFFSDIPKP